MSVTATTELERVHDRLERQLCQHFGSAANVPVELRSFIDAVDHAYQQYDRDLASVEKDDLNQAFSLLSATLESTTDGILVVDMHGKMVQMNRKFLELWRIPAHIQESRDDKQAIDFVLDQLTDPEQFQRTVQELYDQPNVESFDVLSFKDGRIFERYSLPQRIAGETVGRVWSFRDVTTRRQLEEQLRQSLKMEAIGALAGGIAHDFNNLLTVIRGHAEFLKDAFDPSQAEYADAVEIATAADRAAALTHHLLAFSRKQMLQPVPLDLSAVIVELTPMLRRLIGEDLAITVNCDPERGIVIADPGQVEQVLLNLVVNARDAMPDGGRIDIATRNVHLDERSPHVSDIEVSVGDYVLLSVSDTGSGIPPEHRDRIFEPFFTTKGVGHGTGLGLSTVFGIVKQSGGQIALESEVNVGSVFKIYLPRSTDRTSIESRVASGDRQPTGSETILLAEDEDAVRTLVRRILERQGYSVIAAQDGAHAIDLAAKHEGRIDLLLTDVIMPGMGGLELSDHIRRARPGVRVLFMSGYTDNEIGRRGVLGEDSALLEKPFTGDGLAKAVRNALQ